MATILNISTGVIKLSLHGLHSLLWISDAVDSVITILHESLSDFLFDKERAGKFLVDINISHADIVQGSSLFFTHWNSQEGDSLLYV